jgi:hypothetical protein
VEQGQALYVQAAAFKPSNTNSYSFFVPLCVCVSVLTLNINTNVDTVSGVRFLVYPTLCWDLNECSHAKICECVCLEHAESSTLQHVYVMRSCFGVASSLPLAGLECTREFVRNRDG